MVHRVYVRLGQQYSMSETPDGTCQRKGCEDPATTTVEWKKVTEPLDYCGHHASLAVQMFPVVAEKVDGDGETGESAGTTA